MHNLRNDATVPDGGDEVILADHMLAVPNDPHEKVENLGFNRYLPRCAMELATVCIQLKIFKHIEQLATPAAAFDRS